MNVDDILSDQIPTDFTTKDRLAMMFERQHELAKKYVPLEKKNGLLQTEDMPVNLDDRHGQARLKDFFWRITEELTEAVEARRDHAHLPQHCLEEIIDALHFMIEALLLSGIGANDLGGNSLEQSVSFYIIQAPLPLERVCWETVQKIGDASNCLKQRPWKQTHQLTDKEKFKNNLVAAFHQLIYVCAIAGMSADDIFRFYWKKSEVNKFRQRSNY